MSSIRDELSSSKEIGSSGDLSLNYRIVQLGLHLSTIRSGLLQSLVAERGGM